MNWIVDADIRSFFDEIDHQWMLRFLEHRIADQRIIRLIRKWLEAGVIEDGKRVPAVKGTRRGRWFRRCWRISICTTPSISGFSTGGNSQGEEMSSWRGKPMTVS